MGQGDTVMNNMQYGGDVVMDKCGKADVTAFHTVVMHLEI